MCMCVYGEGERDLRSPEFPRNLWRRRGARYGREGDADGGKGNFCRVQLSGRRFAVPVFARARKSISGSLSSSLPSFVDPLTLRGSKDRLKFFDIFFLFPFFPFSTVEHVTRSAA